MLLSSNTNICWLPFHLWQTYFKDWNCFLDVLSITRYVIFVFCNKSIGLPFIFQSIFIKIFSWSDWVIPDSQKLSWFSNSQLIWYSERKLLALYFKKILLSRRPDTRDKYCTFDISDFLLLNEWNILNFKI